MAAIRAGDFVEVCACYDFADAEMIAAALNAQNSAP